MARTRARAKRLRKDFGEIHEIAEVPDLLRIQQKSYEFFLHSGAPVGGKHRPHLGLRGAFDAVFPITSLDGSAELEFVDYKLGEPRFDEKECRRRDLTYGAPLHAKFRLNLFAVDEESGQRTFLEGKEKEDNFLGDVPLMTDKGTFIVNGAERVVVSQIHRSPGVFFEHDSGKKSVAGKLRYSGQVIPARGTWLGIEFDTRDRINFRLNRDARLPVTTLLYAFDLSREEICRGLYPVRTFRRVRDGNWEASVDLAAMRGSYLKHDLVNAETGEVAAKKGARVSKRLIDKLEAAKFQRELVPGTALIGLPLASDVIDRDGVVLADAGAEVTQEVLDDKSQRSLEILDLPETGGYVYNQIASELKAENQQNRERGDSRELAVQDIYRLMQGSEPPSVAIAERAFDLIFQDQGRYDLSVVGRTKMNERLQLQDVANDHRLLRPGDVIALVRELEVYRRTGKPVDDIDHLGNRRVRLVGEMMERQYYRGLARMERAISDMLKHKKPEDLKKMTPEDLINARAVSNVVRDFLVGSPLSQFMDQTNPLAEMAHKRRVSALGPGGLNRRNATFEARDVHRTHYGRICPVETPEGQNIGLVNSFATFAQVDDLGFIQTPFRRVEHGQVTDKIEYLSASEEIGRKIAQADEPLDRSSRFANAEVMTRSDDGHNEVFDTIRRNDVDLIDVSPKQVVSVSASLIPFLENDDANRALMGSNMQRQAMPLLEAEAPFVGTGMEEIVARDSGAAVTALNAGVVDQVDAKRIVVRITGRTDSDDVVDIYRLQKFQRSNQNTAINQRPLVRVGDRVAPGDVIADGPSTNLGELALGRNVLVAFMPWQGYNFEDSILVSERVVRDDVFTSISIEEYRVAVRDTKLGPELITRELPNATEGALANLDEAGIVYIGAKVRSGDILVGKVTPKGDTPTSPEEKLVRAVFQERAEDVRDTSLRLPPGDSGTVLEVQVFTRSGVEKDERARLLETEEVEREERDRDDELAILERNLAARLRELLNKEKLSKASGGLSKGKVLDMATLQGMSSAELFGLAVANREKMDRLERFQKQHSARRKRTQKKFQDREKNIRSGDDLPSGLIKQVKVYVAVKRKVQPGDKMAGRHGNKGVISRVLPIEDMPYLSDGTPVDVVLNPLGVPSRMNVGQVLETHLGWAAHGLGRMVNEALEQYEFDEDSGKSVARSVAKLRRTMEGVYDKDDVRDNARNDKELAELARDARHGVHFATPVFDGASVADITEMLHRAGVDESGQEILYDGRTGEPFDREVTVGYKYLMKLHHLVEDKIHARSTGPYSLVTQQPVRGKSRFGGQRFGEMEVWALQAYGAAHTLREVLTYKSDDVSGRKRVFDAITKGESNFSAGRPESFNVLVNELRALGLSIDFLADEEFPGDEGELAAPPQLTEL